MKDKDNSVKDNICEELELPSEYSKRNDDIYDAVFELCKVLTEKPDLEWDMEFIGEITDMAASILIDQGFRIRYPTIIIEPDGRQYFEEYYNES